MIFGGMQVTSLTVFKKLLSFIMLHVLYASLVALDVRCMVHPICKLIRKNTCGHTVLRSLLRIAVHLSSPACFTVIININSRKEIKDPSDIKLFRRWSFYKRIVYCFNMF